MITPRDRLAQLIQTRHVNKRGRFADMLASQTQMYRQIIYAAMGELRYVVVSYTAGTAVVDRNNNNDIVFWSEDATMAQEWAAQLNRKGEK